MPAPSDTRDVRAPLRVVAAPAVTGLDAADARERGSFAFETEAIEVRRRAGGFAAGRVGGLAGAGPRRAVDVVRAAFPALTPFAFNGLRRWRAVVAGGFAVFFLGVRAIREV